VLVSFDGIPVTGVDDLHRALTRERAGIQARLRLLRRTEMLTVEVTPRETYTNPPN
jgi:S1-C subfamily serine protease